MTQYSYSRVSLYQQCPLRYKYHYIDAIPVDHEYTANEPRMLGKCLDTGIEHGFDKAEQYYRTCYPYIDQESEFELTKLKYWIDKLYPVYKDGQFQIDLRTSGFQGYADWYKDGYLCDFKYASPRNVDKYRNSAQLHLYYKTMTELGYDIKQMEYVIIPRIAIRQKKLESTTMFYNRLMETLESTEIIHVPIDFDEKYVQGYEKSIGDIVESTETDNFPAVINSYCRNCDYKFKCPKYLNIK